MFRSIFNSYWRIVVSATALSALLLQSSLPQPARAAEFEYPELQVTPRASDRLEREAKREAETHWDSTLPYATSGAATLLAGILTLTSKDPNNSNQTNTAIAGIATGGAWIVTSALLAMRYRPYQKGWSEVSGLPKKSQREILTRERIAEEALEEPARLGRRLTLLSTLSNFVVSAIVFSSAKEKSLGKVAGGVSMGVALAPILFTSHWVQVSNDQQTYKKRIFGTVSSGPTLMRDPQNGKFSFGYGLALRF